MIVRRRTWLYRLPGQRLVRSITFNNAVTASKVREVLARTVGVPRELWGRSPLDLA